MGIEKDIVVLRNRLEDLMSSEYNRDEVVELSQELDKLIEQYMEESKGA